MNGATNSVVVIEDHAVIAEFLRRVAQEIFPQAEVRSAVTFAAGLREVAVAPAPALVLLDLELKDGDGLLSLHRLRKTSPDLRIVVFSARSDLDSVVDALAAGAAGYVPSTSAPAVVRAALHLVAAGGTYVPPEALGTGADLRPRRSAPVLTGRQRDVMRLIVAGRSNKEIAKSLNLAEDTVKQHARSAYAVLGVGSRTQALIAVTQRAISLD